MIQDARGSTMPMVQTRLITVMAMPPRIADPKSPRRACRRARHMSTLP